MTIETKFTSDGVFNLDGFSRVPVPFWKRWAHKLSRGRYGDDGMRGPPPTALWVNLVGGGGGGGSGSGDRSTLLPLEPGTNTITVGDRADKPEKRD